MKAKILTTETEKNKGVIGRDKLDPDEVFVFMKINPHTGFHMQGVPFALAIAFLDKDYSIIDIKEMEPEKGRATAPEGTVVAVEADKEYFSNKKLKNGDFWKEVFNLLSISKI